MAVYHLSEARLELWKAWLTLNRIPTKAVVRDKLVTITEEHVKVVEFDMTSGTRVFHDCVSCPEGAQSGHLAKVLVTYPLVEKPGAWAAADQVSE